MRQSTLLADSATSALRAMAAAGVARFLVVSSALLFGGGGVGAGFFRWLIGPHLRDCQAMEAAVRESSTEWTIARPPRLVHDKDDVYRVRVGELPESASLFRSRASWRAVATFLLDATSSHAHVREVVGMCR
jgi:hypothetical protein